MAMSGPRGVAMASDGTSLAMGKKESKCGKGKNESPAVAHSREGRQIQGFTNLIGVAPQLELVFLLIHEETSQYISLHCISSKRQG